MSYVVVRKSKRDENGKMHLQFLFEPVNLFHFSILFSKMIMVNGHVLLNQFSIEKGISTFVYVVLTVDISMWLSRKINMESTFLIKSFHIEYLFSCHIYSRAIHRLSHHAAPGDLFPVTGELIEEEQNSKPDRETESTLKRSRRRAFRT